MSFGLQRLLQIPPLYTVTLALIAGDALGNLGVFAPPSVALALAAGAAMLYIAARPAFALALVLTAIVAAATVPVHRLLSPRVTPTSLTRFPDDAAITLVGRLVREPEYAGRGRTYLYMRAERADRARSNRSLRPDRADPAGLGEGALPPASGLVRVAVIGPSHFRIGDEITVTGRLRFPRNNGNPGEFDYRAWLMRQGIAATMFVGQQKAGAAPTIAILDHRDPFPAAQIERIRAHIGAFIDGNLRYPENAEMRALIIGDRGGIDENLRQTFALTGMAHLLVISGLHLGFVAAVAFLGMRRVMGLFPTQMALGYANKIAAFASALAVCAYAVIAGHHVSTIRALVMVLAYAIAIMIDRASELTASLALAALVVCFAIPGSTADIGFQLSFVSVLAILLGMRRFDSWWRRRWSHPSGLGAERTHANLIGGWIVGYVAVSFWALVGTAPLTAFHFNQCSIVGLVANAIVVPIMGLGAVICGLAAAATSFVWAAPARELLSIAGRLAAAGTWLAGWFATWPLGWSRIFTPTFLELAISYGFVLIWLLPPPEAVKRGATPLIARHQGRVAPRLQY